MSQSVLYLAFPITSRQSNSSPQPKEDPIEEDLLNYQKKRQIFCLGVGQVKLNVYHFPFLVKAMTSSFTR